MKKFIRVAGVSPTAAWPEDDYKVVGKLEDPAIEMLDPADHTLNSIDDYLDFLKVYQGIVPKIVETQGAWIDVPGDDATLLYYPESNRYELAVLVPTYDEVIGDTVYIDVSIPGNFRNPFPELHGVLQDTLKRFREVARRELACTAKEAVEAWKDELAGDDESPCPCPWCPGGGVA